MRGLSKMLVVVLATAALAAGYVATGPAAFGQDIEKFCGKAVQLPTVLDGSNIDADNPDSIKAYARKVVRVMKKLAKSAPTAELRKDLKAVVKDYAKIAKSGDPSDGTDVEPQTRIKDYIAANCTVPTS